MNRLTESEDALRRVLAASLAMREGARNLPDLDVETVQALAAGTYPGADRVELLDRALAHPVTARELQFFADLAAATPAAASRRPVRVWALAAMALLAVGAASIWGVRRWGGEEAVRGDEEVLRLIEPATGQTLGPGSRFTWRSAPGAAGYRLELVDGEGELAFSVATLDTVASLPDSLTLRAGTYQARVSATLRDGTATRSPATRFSVP